MILMFYPVTDIRISFSIDFKNVLYTAKIIRFLNDLGNLIVCTAFTCPNQSIKVI